MFPEIYKAIFCLQRLAHKGALDREYFCHFQ